MRGGSGSQDKGTISQESRNGQGEIAISQQSLAVATSAGGAGASRKVQLTDAHHGTCI